MNIYLQYIITGASIAGFLGIAFAQFGRSRRGESGEIIDFYKKESESYKDMMQKKEVTHAAEIKEITAHFTAQVNALTREVGELRGQYNAEKKQREEYELILKDKNPETQKFMELVVKSCNDQNSVNKEVVDSLKQMAGILKEIYTMAQAEHDRDFKIESTITKA